MGLDGRRAAQIEAVGADEVAELVAQAEAAMREREVGC